MAKDDSGSRLISNSAYLMTDWIVATVLSFLFWLIASRLLPISGFGIAATTVNTALLIAAFGMVGVNAVVTNLIPIYMKKKLIEKVKGITRFSLKFVLVVNMASSLVVAAFSPQIASLLNLPVEGIWMVSIMIFGWGFWFLTNGLFQGMQNMRLIFRSNLVGQIIKVTMPLALFFIGLEFLSPIIAFTISLLATVLIRLPFLPFGKGAPVNGKEIIIKLGLPIFIASVMWLVFTNLPNVILNSIKSPDVTGIFALALTLVTPIVFIPMTLSTALFPVTSGLSATLNPQKRQSKLISLVVKFAAFITIPAIAVLLVFSDQIILLFSGKAENLFASQILPIIAPAALLLGIGQILVSSIFAIGKPKVTRNITIITTLIFIGLSIPATFLFSSMGMSVIYLISMVFLTLTSFFYLRKEINLNIDWVPVFKIFVATFLLAGIILPLNSLFESAALKIVSIVAGLLVYLLFLVPIRYYSKDDLKILRFLSSRLKFLNGTISSLEKFLSRYIS